MGVPSEDAVVVEPGKKPGDPTVVTVNCPDKTGLGCDISRIVLEFGLRITRGDLTTDGKWCYVVIWVLPRSPATTVRWDGLKVRLLSICPSFSVSFYYTGFYTPPRETPVYLLKLFSVDRTGLLHDVTSVLCELELLISRVKVSTTPDGRVVDFFFITDGKELMHTQERQEETCMKLNTVLGESCVHCEIEAAGPEFEAYRQQGFSSVPSEVADKLFSSDADKGVGGQRLNSDVANVVRKATVSIDNSLSPAHSLLQIHCVDQKGLLYDILRTLKDCNIQIAYGRFLMDTKGSRDVDLFVNQNDGKKIVDPQKQQALCSRLRMEMLHPLRVVIVSRGPETELLVANPVELCGKGRPRVFYDVTLALKVLGIPIFSAEIGRHSTQEREWEVYRLLLEETREFPLGSSRARNRVAETVRRTLMGW